MTADEEFNVDGMWEESVRLYRVDGRIHALPYDHGPIILGYNKDMFDAAGMDTRTKNGRWKTWRRPPSS